jgi:hypothetical protein
MSFVVKQSIILTLARAESETVSGVDGTVADSMIRVPDGGRSIEGGQGSFVNQETGDYLTIDLRDDDNLLGFGAGTLISTFTDTGVSASNGGWYFMGSQPLVLHPVVDNDPSNLPGGFYLHVCGHKRDPALADTLFVNFHWGLRV